MNKIIVSALAATCFSFTAGPAFAGSCCGGGSGASLILAKSSKWMFDFSNSVEIYDGFWDQDGNWIADPKGSDLKQYRNTLGVGYRFASRWFTTVSLPYVWNRNSYSGGLTANSSGLGDTGVSLWYESFENITCVFKVRDIRDLMPAIYWGVNVTVPTGISPYDNIDDNFKITGRGFYQAGANLIIDKTIYPWTGAINLGYAKHLERPVNMDYGNHVEPYQKQLGDRATASISSGYVYFMENMSELTTTVAYSYLHEGKSTVDGVEDASTGLSKHGLALNVSWTDPMKIWVVKASWGHTVKSDNWGYNFPSTDSYTVGVSYAIK